MIGNILGKQQFDGLRRPLMQELTAFDQNRVVGDLLGQRVLKDVFDTARVCQLLVDKLAQLQIGEHPARVRHLRLKECAPPARAGTLFPITANVCSRSFSSAGRRSIRADSMACTVVGIRIAAQSLVA